MKKFVHIVKDGAQILNGLFVKDAIIGEKLIG